MVIMRHSLVLSEMDILLSLLFSGRFTIDERNLIIPHDYNAKVKPELF